MFAVYKKEFRTYPKRLKCEITEMERPTYKQVIEKLQHQYYTQTLTKINDAKVELCNGSTSAQLYKVYRR